MTSGFNIQIVTGHNPWAKDNRQEFAIDYVLPLCDQDSSTKNIFSNEKKFVQGQCCFSYESTRTLHSGKLPRQTKQGGVFGFRRPGGYAL